MLFSVVVPVLNEEKLLPGCLESLNKLDFHKDMFEVIVVDNGSVDRSVDIAKRYGAKVVHEKRQGITFARQTGLDEALGKYYITTDADARVPTNWLTVAKRIFESNTDVVGITGPARLHDRSPLFSTIIEFIDWVALRSLVRGHIQGCNMAMKTREAKEVGGFLLNNYGYYEDAIISARLQKVGKIYHSKDLYVYISYRRYAGWKVFRAFRNIFNYYSMLLFGRLLTDTFEISIRRDAKNKRGNKKS